MRIVIYAILFYFLYILISGLMKYFSSKRTGKDFKTQGTNTNREYIDRSKIEDAEYKDLK